MNDLLVETGGIVSVQPLPDVKNPPRILSEDDNLKLAKFDSVPDSILFELFLRLPNGRSAVQCSSVCKRWSSIISSSAFIRTFIHIHDHICPQSSRPFTLLFARYDLYHSDDDPFCQVFSEKSKFPYGIMPSVHLNFLPHLRAKKKRKKILPYRVAILASFNDLLLATSFEHWLLGARNLGPNFGAKRNYICNPLTKQWLELPEVSVLYIVSGYGLVCEPNSCSKQLGCTSNVRYRVVIIGRAHSNLILGKTKYFIPQCRKNEFIAQVFCSETGQWSELVISYPETAITRSWGTSNLNGLHIVARNGILYWLEGDPVKGIVAFDPFNDVYKRQCRLISLPVVCFKTASYLDDVRRERLGLVNGQLRLSQFYEWSTYYVFTVWELKNCDSESPSWVLVYNLKLNYSKNRVFMLSFHPNNTDVVFLLCGNDICLYDISMNKYEKVGECPNGVKFPETDISIDSLLYPSWPTPIPELPCN
ncbi:F-box domain containing protein [Trema orientale]|uniref:F-box domain containing protein n=1 Tax=Trema orientale TaxID=63057 RepID=A0A2P5F2I5_TREOI|nr:F-box domain containing protein [Trema orientale]